MKFPPEGIRLSPHNLHMVRDAITKGLNEGNIYRLRIDPWQEKRSLSQNSMFHAWMRELSRYLIAHGRSYCTDEWCKDAMKFTFLGFEEKEFVDVITGARIVRETLKQTSKLKTGEMFDFMTKVQNWCLDIGCMLTVNEHSEFFENQRKQET